MEYPRWRDDTTLLVAMQPAQQMPGLYALTLRRGDTTVATPRRVARRNSLDANVPLADGTLLFAQFEQVDPFTLRSDLWLEQDGREVRLTRGARLSHPDAPMDDVAASARIVAVQSVDGTTADRRASRHPVGRAALATGWRGHRCRATLTRWHIGDRAPRLDGRAAR
jgi:hypothetical protein